MKKVITIFVSVIIVSGIGTLPAHAGSLCNNGKYSANSGRGTCSYNGGVDKTFPSFSDPGSSSYNRNNRFGTSPSTRNNDFGNTFGSTGKNGLTGKSCPKGRFIC
jgi:hypothetical protein